MTREEVLTQRIQQLRNLVFGRGSRPRYVSGLVAYEVEQLASDWRRFLDDRSFTDSLLPSFDQNDLRAWEGRYNSIRAHVANDVAGNGEALAMLPSSIVVGNTAEQLADKAGDVVSGKLMPLLYFAGAIVGVGLLARAWLEKRGR